ncbi:MAG: iron ABC transporter permease [Acidimicrobiia bacterium]|nr:iron ABC transporter permease [Acidimicrobiia bacterium]
MTLSRARRAAWPGRLARILVVAIPLGFLAVAFLYPLSSILLTGLSGEAGALGPFGEVFGKASLRSVAWFTLWQAVVSTILTVVVAMPAAYVFARYDFPGRSLLRAAVTIPFVLPTLVVGSAFLALLGPRGALGIDLSSTIWAILLAHVFYNYAVVVRTVGGLWAHLDPRLTEAARVLGAGRWRAFRTVSLPLLRPAIAAAASIIFLFTFTSFGVILVLGNLEFRTIEVEIWRQTMSFLNLPVAAALSVLQLVAVSLILLAYSRYQQRRAVEQRLAPATARKPQTAREWWMVGGTLTFTALFLGTPLLLLVERSLQVGEGWSTAAYTSLTDTSDSLFVPATEAIANSIGFGLVAMIIALVVGILAATVIAYRQGPVSQWFDLLLMLPLGTSAVTIGFGFLVAFDSPIDLRTSPFLIPLAHSLIAIPFVVRTVVPVMQAIRRRLREAARVLGASPFRAWREIDLPLIARSGLVAAGFAFAISLGEFGATAFLVRPERPTMPIAIFRLLGRPGELNFGRAMALSTILMVLTAASIMIIERFRLGETGEF